jgi:hypothetical protein
MITLIKIFSALKIASQTATKFLQQIWNHQAGLRRCGAARYRTSGVSGGTAWIRIAAYAAFRLRVSLRHKHPRLKNHAR